MGRVFQSRCRRAALLVAFAAATACGQPAFFTTVIEARRLAAELRLQFTKTVDASNRAVMSAGQAESAGAAAEAAGGRGAVKRLAAELRPVLAGRLTPEVGHLDAFVKRFAEYESLDGEILALTADSTNHGARRLAAGAGQQAADAFRDALAAAVQGLGPDLQPAASLLAAKARMAVLEIQVIESRHIPEADAGAMTVMETAMDGLERTARMTLEELRARLPANRLTLLATAGAALDRFATTHAEVMALSRRNSNVQSLMLSLGRKRALTIGCDDALAALEAALAKHQFTGTR